MNVVWGRRLQAAAALLFFGTYAGLSHYSNASTHARSLGAVLALGPLLGGALLALWRFTGILTTAAFACLLIGILARNWTWVGSQYPWFYVLQDLSLNAMLAVAFGRTLLPNRIPLCTQFADQVHGPLLDVELTYTRRVTAAWTGFFVADALTTLGLFIAAPLRVWSFFSYILSPILLVGMFVGEYFLRRVALPQRHRGGILDGLYIYFQGSR